MYRYKKLHEGSHGDKEDGRKPDLQELPSATNCLVLLPGKALALHTSFCGANDPIQRQNAKQD